MEIKYQIFYQNMLSEIDKCWQSEKPDKDKAEDCFWIAHHYCDCIKKFAIREGFSGNEDEINFFRNVKPQFFCFLDYYVLLSEVLLFVPAKIELELDFWNEEARRFHRFCNKHNEFIAYYESGSNHMNDQYFLRKNVHSIKRPAVQNECDTDLCTYFDLLLGKYLAQKKYLEYILCRKNNLSPQAGNS